MGAKRSRKHGPDNNDANRLPSDGYEAGEYQEVKHPRPLSGQSIL